MLIHFMERKGEDNGRRENYTKQGKECDTHGIHTAGSGGI